MKTPTEWQNIKFPDGPTLVEHINFKVAEQMHKWPSPHAAPDFTITEDEFDAALAAAKEV
jgi:hypothetical protein